jgi:hypothetical protein
LLLLDFGCGSLVPPEEPSLTSAHATVSGDVRAVARAAQTSTKKKCVDPRKSRLEEEEAMKKFELVIAGGGLTASDGSLASGAFLASYGSNGRLVGALTVKELETVVKDLIAERARFNALAPELVGGRSQ